MVVSEGWVVVSEGWVGVSEGWVGVSEGRVGVGVSVGVSVVIRAGRSRNILVCLEIFFTDNRGRNGPIEKAWFDEVLMGKCSWLDISSRFCLTGNYSCSRQEFFALDKNFLLPRGMIDAWKHSLGNIPVFSENILVFTEKNFFLNQGMIDAVSENILVFTEKNFFLNQGMIDAVFGPVEKKWVDAYFPFTGQGLGFRV